MEINNATRAEILTQALPYIRKYHDRVAVVKYGGNAMINEELKQQVMEDIVLLSLTGMKIVLVHGGGPEITSVLEKMGKSSVFADGLRVTDGETMDVVQMVLAGRINKSLVNLLALKGGKSIGVSGVDGRLLRAEPLDPRLGFVGRITDVNAQVLTDLLEKGYIPVVSTIGCDEAGNVYNVNADTAASFIACALNAERLITMTDISGILKDKDDPSSIIPLIDVEEAKRLTKAGVITGGMIPKIKCCIDAVEQGVKKVIIIDGRIPHAILLETLTAEGAGTMVVKNLKEHKVERT